MTQDEAKTKWCPFARTVRFPTDDPVSPREWYSTQGRFGSHPTCIGSACMAWRPVLLGTNDQGDKLHARDNGFCGLAGAPK